MKDTRILTALLLGKKMEGNNVTMFDVFQTITKIRRLAKKHQRLAEYSCNGEGVINGIHYTTAIGKKSVPADVYYTNKGMVTAYITDDNEITMFDKLSEGLPEKIKSLAKSINCNIETQGDPRGWTVKINYSGFDFSELIH